MNKKEMFFKKRCEICREHDELIYYNKCDYEFHIKFIKFMEDVRCNRWINGIKKTDLNIHINLNH